MRLQNEVLSFGFLSMADAAAAAAERAAHLNQTNQNTKKIHSLLFILRFRIFSLYCLELMTNSVLKFISRHCYGSDLLKYSSYMDIVYSCVALTFWRVQGAQQSKNGKNIYGENTNLVSG